MAEKGESKKDYIHFRTSSEMREQLDAIVEDLRRKGTPASRSSVARSMLHKQLGNPATVAEVEEVLIQVNHVVQRAIGRAVNDLGPAMTHHLQDELQALRQER